MAGKVIETTLVANSKGVVAGAKDAADAFEKVSDSLDDMAKDAQRAATTSEKGLDKIGDEAKDSSSEVEKLEASFRELATTSQRTTADSASSFQVSEGEKRRAVKESLNEIKNEARQNAAETFSSFDGSVSSLVSGVQGTFGGIVAGLGPVGAAIGAAGAAAIGVVSGLFQKADEQSQAFKEHVKELAGQLFSSGTVGQRAFSDLKTEIQDMATETDDAKTNLGNLKFVAQSLKKPLADVVSAYVQGGPALDSLIEKAKEHRDLVVEEFNAGGGGKNPHNLALAEERDNLDMVIGKLQEQSKAYKAAREAQLLALTAGADKYDIAQAGIESIATAYDDVRKSASDAATAQDGAFDVNSYLSGVEKAKAALVGFKSNLANMKLTPDEWDNFFALDENVQQSLAASWSSGDQTLKDRIAGSLDDAGKTGGAKAAISYDAAMKTATGKSYVGQVDLSISNPNAIQQQWEKWQRYLDGHPLRVTGTTAGRFGVGVQ